MIKTIKVILIFMILVLISQFYNNLFTLNSLVGNYYNVNFKNSFVGPTTADTLTLQSNHVFISRKRGIGKFSISRSLFGTRIKLDYQDQSQLDFETYISRGWF